MPVGGYFLPAIGRAFARVPRGVRGWLFLALLLPCGLFAQSDDSPGGGADPFADLGDFVRDLVSRQLESRKIAGAVVSIVKDGAVLLSEAYGLANVENGESMRPDTIVRIAAITKTLTAIAVMQLVEAGSLDLDQDVNQYLDFAIPERRGLPNVTLRRLLSHRTGFEDRHGGVGARRGERPPLGPLLARRMPPRIQSNGDLVTYSNYNAALAAYIVERASGRSYEQYLAEAIFEPLGMTRTTAMQPLPSSLAAFEAKDYVRTGVLRPRLTRPSATIYEVGSTGVGTSGAEMARWMLALLDDDPKILSRDMLRAMMTAEAPTPLGFHGLGFYSPVGRGNGFIGHEGETGGFRSALALLPRERFGLFVSYNSEGIPQRLPASAELLQHIWDRHFAHIERESSTSDGGVPLGYFQPTRRVESSFFKLRVLVDQLNIRRTRDGRIAFDELTLEPAEAGKFRAPGVEVGFSNAAAVSTVQFEAPSLYVPLPWWAGRTFNALLLGVCLLVSAVTVIAWPLRLLRRSAASLDALTVWLQAATRLALLLSSVAIVGAFWLVLWGSPLVAQSSPLVPPLVFGIYTAAWSALALAPLTAWYALRYARSGAGGWPAKLRECSLVLVALLLCDFCIYWRIAGTSLDF